MTGQDEAEGEVEGVVLEVLPSALFRVRLSTREEIVAHMTRAPRRNFVRILVGDRVRVARSARNRTRGRITGRIG